MTTTAAPDDLAHISRATASASAPTLWIKRGPHLLGFFSYIEVFSVPGSNQCVYIQRYREHYSLVIHYRTGLMTAVTGRW